MKKIVFVFGLILTMVSCSGNSTKTTEVNDSTTVDSIEICDSSLIDTITIR